MGLDAFVRCCCWERGLCRPICLAAHIVVGADNFLDIDLPWETHEADILAFDQWRMDACEHENMGYARAWIGDWSGYRNFQQAVRLVALPTLMRELPAANDGLTYPEAARTCLRELDEFDGVGSIGRYRRLVDEATGDVVNEHSPAWAWFQANGATGFRFGFEPDGTMAIRDRTGAIVFRSSVFEQRPVPGGAAFTDLATGNTFTCPDGIEKGKRLPARLRVIDGPDSTARYARLVKALRTVFTASVEIDHPVSWC